LIDERSMKALELVDRAAAAAVGRGCDSAEQLRDPAVDGLLRRRQRLGHLGVPRAAGHHVQDLPIGLLRLAAPGEALGDRGVDRGPSRRHLPDGPDELVTLRDAVLQQVREPAVPLSEQSQGVRLVVVGGQHHDARPRMLASDLVRAVDPLEAEARRHLDVGHDDVGFVLGSGREQRGGVLGDADDLHVRE
jgi:hypothetical protein